MGLCECNSSTSTPMSVEQFENAISGADVKIVDLRSKASFEGGLHIPGAISIPLDSPSPADSLAKYLESKNGTIAVYSDDGGDCQKAAAILDKLGYGSIASLGGGIDAWVQAGKPLCDKWDFTVFSGDEAPDFEVELFDPMKDYEDGYAGGGHSNTMRLSDLRGKVVMIQFTASWCGVCALEMPHIESEIWKKYSSRDDFALVGIDRDEPWEKISAFIAKTGITYPMAFDPAGKVFDLYAVHDSGITRNILIDRDGKIVHRTRLYNPTEFQGLVDKIETLLRDR